MPLSEIEISNLRNDGKFNEQDIQLFVDKSIGYNEIKKIQDKIHSNENNITKSFEEINPQVMNVIREKIDLSEATMEPINYLLNRYGGRKSRKSIKSRRNRRSRRSRSRRIRRSRRR